MTYVFTFSVDLCKAISEVGALIDSVNAGLSTFGVPDRVGVRSRALRMTVESPRALTKQETAELRDESLAVIRDRFPQLDVRFESVRRQSRKSSSQPKSR